MVLIGCIIWKRQKFKHDIVWVPEQADAVHCKVNRESRFYK